MGRNLASLNAKQVGVLEWIRNGCRGEVDDDYSRRITARALNRRRLVTVRGHGATWTASITKAGREWLDSHATVTGSERAAADPDDLIQRVVDAGGRLDVGDTYEVRLAYEGLVKASHHSPARPMGWRLELKSTGSWSEPRYEVVLIRHFDDLVQTVPVPVPTDVARYHPAVKALLAGRGRQAVTKEHVARAARILQALTAEAPRRGIDALVPNEVPPGLDTYRAREVKRAHVVLRAPGSIYCSIRVREVVSQIEAPLEPTRLRRGQVAWPVARKAEAVSTGVLEVIVEGAGMGYTGYRFRDSKTATLEEKLPRTFRAIEIERLRSEWRDQERERAAAERRDRWETAMAEARVKYEEQARWDAFVARSNEWDAIVRHRRFLAAARASTAAVDALGDTDAFLASAEQLLDRRDPILHPELILPDIKPPNPDDLRPFLDGWSPYGPDALR